MFSQNWINHALRRGPWETRRQAVALVALVLFVAVIVGVLYVTQAAGVSTTGRQVEELVAVRNNLEKTNEQLRAEIAELQSVPRLLSRAQELGFAPAPPERIEYLVVDGYNPHREQTLAPLEENEEPVPVYDETFTGWLQQQWDSLRSQFEGFTRETEAQS
jgi:cell division protein FtsL